MAQLFLSHSSLDKPFVTRLAIDLLNNDVPVWLDNWELAPGDSLLARIYEGLGTSDCIAVILSPHSLESQWVKKELRAALSKEEAEGRQVVLPLKIARCSPPLEIADRIYVDLSDSYHFNLEVFVNRLKALGLTGASSSPERELIPLRFANGLHLDENALCERLKCLRDRIPIDHVLSTSQLLPHNDEAYVALRRGLQARLDSIEDEADYSPELDRRVRAAYSRVRRLEQMLLDGVSILIQRVLRREADANAEYMSTSCRWFALYFRQMIYSSLVMYQPNDSRIPSYFGRSSYGDPFEGRTFCRLYGLPDISHIMACDIWPKERRTHDANVMVWIDRRSEIGEWFTEHPQVPDMLLAWWTPQFAYDYFLPQMVFKHVANGGPLHWDIGELMIGLH